MCTGKARRPRSAPAVVTLAAALAAALAACGGSTDPLGESEIDPPPVAARFVAVGAGDGHTCGLTDLGWVRCWGRNSAGQLGNGSWGPGVESSPLAVAQGSQVFASIDLGGDHSCALDPDREIWCWGSDAQRQLGYLDDAPLESCGADACSTFPRSVIPGTRFRTMATGRAHTCAGTSLGTLYCWGENVEGQAGSGGPSDKVPFAWPVDGQHFFAAVWAGGSHTCGVTMEGGSLCWGRNAEGQVGTLDPCDAFPGSCAAPVAVAEPEALTHLALGEAHTCALTAGGVAWCWGRGGSGALGNGEDADRSVPVRVDTELRFAALSAGGTHTCGLTESGEAWCWGAGGRGQLGNGGTGDGLRPVRAGALAGLVSIAAGGEHTCAADGEGRAWCWGANGFGQLGDGSTDDRASPVAVGG